MTKVLAKFEARDLNERISLAGKSFYPSPIFMRPLEIFPLHRLHLLSTSFR
jgi:hypothetical protein